MFRRFQTISPGPLTATDAEIINSMGRWVELLVDKTVDLPLVREVSMAGIREYVAPTLISPSVGEYSSNSFTDNSTVILDPMGYDVILIVNETDEEELATTAPTAGICADITILGIEPPAAGTRNLRIINLSSCLTTIINGSLLAIENQRVYTSTGQDLILDNAQTVDLYWSDQVGTWLVINTTVPEVGITSINTLTGTAQTLVVGATGTDFAIVSSADTHTFNLPDASLTARGVISQANQVMGDGDKWFADKVGFSSNPVVEVGPYLVRGSTLNKLYGTPTMVNLVDDAGVPGVLKAGTIYLESYIGSEPYAIIASGGPYHPVHGTLSIGDSYWLRSGTVGGTENILLLASASHDAANPHDWLIGAWEYDGVNPPVRVVASLAVIDIDSGVRLRGQTGTDGVNTFQGGICIGIGTATGGYTDEQAKDAVGNILTDSATLEFNYDDALDTITADVKANSITLAMQVDVATSTVFYRKTAGTGSPELQTLATLKADLGLSGSNTGDETAATILSKLLTVDGAGSGLDADLLDGISSAGFDAAGTAAAAVSAHEAASDPHPQYLTPAEGDAAYQPLDGDLTALAALTGTNTIYYRSAADTWTAIIIGTGITFTGGTLSATGGGPHTHTLSDITDAGTMAAQNANIVAITGGVVRLDFYQLYDTAGDHVLEISLNENLTAPRGLAITVSDGNRALNLAGDLTVSSAAIISGTNTGDETAAGILTKLLTVDGTGSGLDADLLDGNSSAAFALVGHNHTGTYQPLDGDLTALAALSGTNTIYYRSAANTWTAITIGTGLDFTSGTLSATGHHDAMMVRSTAQSINNATTTKVSLNSEIYDVGNIANPGTGTFTISRAGKYLVIGTFAMQNLAWGEEVWAAIYHNGAAKQWQFMATGSGDTTVAASVAEVLDCAASDTIELYCFHRQGAATNTLTDMQWRPRMSVTEIKG